MNTMALPRQLQTLSENARWLYPLVVLLLAAVLGHFLGLGFSLLVVAGGTLIGSIWLIWASLQGIGGDVPITLEEALSLGAPSAEEEQKRAVLRALKDLEYERAVGKISDADYESLAQHYRTEAKRLLRAVDADLGPERERAEQILAERLAQASQAAAEAKPARSSKQREKAAAADQDGADDVESLAAEPAATKSPSSDAAP